MSLEQASEIQRKMYEYIVSYMDLEGMPPTNREIGRELKIATTGHVDYHLTMLEKKGLISRQAKKSRGIKLTTKPTVGVPVVGTIAVGEPLDIFPDAAQTVDVGRELVESESTYALIVKGCSMIEDHICDGDYVVIKPQYTCQNGDIAVAVHLREGISESATLKRFYQEKEHNRIRLQSANSDVEPILIPKSVWDREWQIQGKVVAIFRHINTDLHLPKAPSMQPPEMSEIETSTLEAPTKVVGQDVSEPSNEVNNPIEQEATAYLESKPGSDASDDTSKILVPSSQEEPQLLITEEMASNARSKIGASQQEVAYEHLHTAVKNNSDQLNEIYKQGHSQANHWFRLGLLAATIGFLVIIGGAGIAIFTGVTTGGILTSIASIIPGAISTLFFQQAKEANKRLDAFYEKLIKLEENNRALELTLTTGDDIQDRYKGLIICQLLGLCTQGQEIPIRDLLFGSQEIHKLTVIKEKIKEF